MKNSTEKDAIGFLPDALALKHAELPWWMKHGIAIMAAAFLILCALAAFTHVDVIVTTTGKLVSDHPTVALKPLERTVIKEIKVAIGDQVKAGQVLATFDPVFSHADAERLAAETARLNARLARLESELEGRDFPQSGNLTDAEKLESKIFADRKDFYNKKMDSFKNEIESLKQSRTSLEQNIGLQSKRLVKLKEIEAMLRDAGKSRAVSARDLKDAEITRMQLEAEISDRKNNILITDSQLLAKRNEQDAFANSWQIELAQDFVKTGSDLTNAQKELAKARQMASYVELRSPEDAVVHDIAPISAGSAIREAETFFTLVPTGGSLEAEVEVKAEDIGKIKSGDPARIKISTFPYQKFGTLKGVVRVISEDSFTPPTPGEKGASSFYKARIAFTGNNRPNEEKLLQKLIPGMDVQGDIQIGTRSILEYIIHPLVKSVSEAIREP